MGQLHHDIDRGQSHVVGQSRAYAEAALDAIGKAVVERQGRVQIQPVREHQTLALRGNAQLVIVGNGLLAPFEGIAGVMAQAVEQLGKVHVEVGQKGVHAHGIGQGDTQVAAVFLHPVLEGGYLEVAQAHAQGLIGLQILMGHGAYGHQIQIARQQHIGRALEPLRGFLGKSLHHLALPGSREAAAHAEVKQLEGVAQPGLDCQMLELGQLDLQALAAFDSADSASKRRKYSSLTMAST
jgi:hypothetical protein